MYVRLVFKRPTVLRRAQNSFSVYLYGIPTFTREVTTMDTTRLSRRRLLQGSGSLALFGLAGCGAPAGQSTDEPAGGDGQSDDHAGHGESEHGHNQVSEPKATREVLVNTARNGDNTEYHFDPHVTWVEVGGTVKWTLESGTHTATAYHPGNDQPRLVPEGTEAWDSGMLSEEGETYEHAFDTEGVYHYYCVPHETFGMLATVIVGEPDLEDQAALQSVPEDKPEEVRSKLQELNEMCHSILDGHHEGEETEDGHDEEGGHQQEEGHHEAETTEHGHEEDNHEEEEEDNHEAETTEHGHEEEENHDAETTTTS